MSLENLDHFAQLVHDDPDLRRKLGEPATEEERIDRAVHLAAGRGLEFSAAEFRDLAERLRPDVRELSDAQLANVAGGTAVEYTDGLALMIYCCITAVTR
jgi:predicted ribosomally synthesized peptide with nif11-like leader